LMFFLTCSEVYVSLLQLTYCLLWFSCWYLCWCSCIPRRKEKGGPVDRVLEEYKGDYRWWWMGSGYKCFPFWQSQFYLVGFNTRNNMNILCIILYYSWQVLLELDLLVNIWALSKCVNMCYS
jgi:hypothetical protein